MAKIRIRQVDTFTTNLHTGNPAAVVLDGEHLTTEQMQLVAREINASETVFVMPSTKPEADVKVRWFSPAEELSASSHATLGAFHVLAETGGYGMQESGKYSFRLECAGGILPVDVTKEETGTSVMIGSKLPALERGMQYKIELVRLLNVGMSDFENRLPILRSEYLYIPFKRLHTLFTMKPNFLAMGAFLTSRRIRGICVFTHETIDRDASVHSRFFSPHVGLMEDPVSGSVHAGLAVHLFEGGFLPVKDGYCRFKAEQGDVLGRRGRVMVELCIDEEKPVAVKIGGQAVTVFEGDMQI